MPVDTLAPSLVGPPPYPTRRALREAREREGQEHQVRERRAREQEAADRSRPVLHMPQAPAALRGLVAFDESHVPGPPVHASSTPTLATRLSAARAAGASVGPHPSRPRGAAAHSGPPPSLLRPRVTPPRHIGAPLPPVSDLPVSDVPPAPDSRPAPSRAPATPVQGAAFVRPPAPVPDAPHATTPATTPAATSEPHIASRQHVGAHGPSGHPPVRAPLQAPRLGRPVRWTAQAMVLAGVVATTGAFTLYHRNLTIDVDGSARSVDAYGWTVGDVLAQQHVHVKAGDVVEPSLSSPARGVDEVVVRTSREVQVEINGDTQTIRTTAATVGELLDAMGDRDAGAVTSASRSEPLGRSPIRLVTSKSVHVLVDGQDVAITTSAATVGDVLDQAGVTLGSKDTTSTPLGAAAVDGMVVLVNRGKTSSTTETEVVKFDSTEIKDPSLPKGQRVVRTAGRVGTVERTYSVTTKGGVEVSRKLVKQTIVSQPVDEVVLVGTMTVPDPSTVVVSPGSAQAIAKAMVAQRGWSSSQFSCLVSLWNRESGWRVTASNPSGAYGIAQAKPGSKMASVGADWRTNASTQITWGLGYIADRYGTPCGAWAHSQAIGWY